jgi:predicted PurR-regulated permease PerM
MKKLFYSDHMISISPISIVFTILFMLGLYGVFYIRSVLVLLLLSFILTVALNPIVLFFNKKLKIPKVPSIAVAYLLVILTFAAILGLIIPPLANQFVQFVNYFDLPFLQEHLVDFNFTLQELSSVISSVGTSFAVLLHVVNTTFSSVFTVFTVMVMSFYLMLEKPNLHKKASWFTKNEKYLNVVEDFISSIELQLGGWVRAQIILMVSIFLITFISLSLISVPYALPLALLAGVLEIVPNLGPTIAMVPAVFVAYVTFGPVMAGIVTLLYIVIQQLENNVLVPKIMKSKANVNPLVGITSILVGLKVGGVVGALLAIPLYIIFRTVFSTFIQPHIRD